MRIVVTGATGNVGSAVVEALAADDDVDEIVGLARRETTWRPAKTRFATTDVATDRLEPHLDGADAVIHLAWLFQPTHRPLVTWAANALGSIRVFDAAAAVGVGAIVHSSSVGTYSPGEGDRRVDETWPTHALPVAAYGREKSYVERALDRFELTHPEMRVVRMRPAFIFQRRAATEQRRLFGGPFVPASLVGRRVVPPVLPIPSGLRFQALHAADAAQAFRLAATTDVRGPFNLAADPVLDPDRLAAALGSRARVVPASRPGPAPAGCGRSAHAGPPAHDASVTDASSTYAWWQHPAPARDHARRPCSRRCDCRADLGSSVAARGGRRWRRSKGSRRW